jgi:hypothetical protein
MPYLEMDRLPNDIILYISEFISFRELHTYLEIVKLDIPSSYHSWIKSNAVNLIRRRISEWCLADIFFSLLREYKAFIAGSFLLSSLFETTYDYNGGHLYRKCDIDIYVRAKTDRRRCMCHLPLGNGLLPESSIDEDGNTILDQPCTHVGGLRLKRAREFEKKIFALFHGNYVSDISRKKAYDENLVISIMTKTIPVEIIRLSDKKKYYLENIDLDCCKMHFDGHDLKIHGDIQCLSRQTQPADQIRNITKYLIRNYKVEQNIGYRYPGCLSNNGIITLIKRCRKYIDRGFKYQSLLDHTYYLWKEHHHIQSPQRTYADAVKGIKKR